MKPISIMLVILAAGMLFFGCTTSTEYSANYSANGSTEAPASGGSQGASGGAPSGASSGSGTAPASGGGSSGATTPPANEPSVPPAQDLSGKNYSDLLGSGYASQCSVSYRDENGAAASLKLYFDGNYGMRMEQDTGHADCPNVATVYKGDSSGNGMLFVTCPNHEEEALGSEFGTHEPCIWQSMEIEIEWGGIGTSSRGLEDGYSTPMLEYLDSPVYSCQAWTLDASKFETPGYVCD